MTKELLEQYPDICKENDALKAQIPELKNHINMLAEEREKIMKHLDDLSKKQLEDAKTIKFLEGQIEAYQYCMNCRR